MSKPTYTEEGVKDKIIKSDIWAARAVMKLVNDQKITAADTQVFTSLMQYYSQFNDFGSKHISLIRTRLVKNDAYLRYLVRSANGN